MHQNLQNLQKYSRKFDPDRLDITSSKDWYANVMCLHNQTESLEPNIYDLIWATFL